MAVNNLWKRFARLTAEETEIVVTITAHNADGTSTVQTMGGGDMILRGQGVAVGQKAFARNGEVQGEAPDLPYYELEI